MKPSNKYNKVTEGACQARRPTFPCKALLQLTKTKGVIYAWIACPQCGKERWVSFSSLKACQGRCISCAQSKRYKENPSPFGRPRLAQHRRTKDTTGYMKIVLAREDPFFPMANKERRVLEHRLIMAKHLDRCLCPHEAVHHKNGIKDDNRIENLELTTGSSHSKAHHSTLAGRISKCERALAEYETQIKLLKRQIKELELAKEKGQPQLRLPLFCPPPGRAN